MVELSSSDRMTAVSGPKRKGARADMQREKKESPPAMEKQEVGASEAVKAAAAAEPDMTEQAVHPEVVATDFNEAGIGVVTENDVGGQDSEGDERADIAAAPDANDTGQKRYLKEHFFFIRDIIIKNLSYPSTARRMGWEGKVLVSFVINNDGFVSDIKIVESSGFGILDKNAVETVKKASPFPRPPVRAELVMPVVYELR